MPDQRKTHMKVKTKLKAGEGLGDLVGRMADALGLKKIADGYERLTGESCGCEKRKEILNNAVSQVPFT